MEFKKEISDEDKKIVYKEGYSVMAKRLRALSVQGYSIGYADLVNQLIDFYFKLNTLPNTVFDIK